MFLDGKSKNECAERVVEKLLMEFVGQKLTLKEVLTKAYIQGTEDQASSYADRIKRGLSNIDPES